MGNKEKYSETTMFFGAGAEIDYGVCAGDEFYEQLFESKYLDVIKIISGCDANRYKLVYPTSRKVFLQTIYDNAEKAKGIFSDAEIELCKKYFDNPEETPKKDIETLCSNCYKSIAKEDGNQEIRSFFFKNAVFFDTLDAKFNWLRIVQDQPNSNSAKVIIAYTSIYLLILEKLYPNEDIHSIKSFKQLFSLLDKEYGCLDSKRCDTYYEKVKNLNCNIITTNYTEIAEKVIGNSKVIHLHGKMTLFEDYKRLAVYDCVDEREELLNNKYIFPFIMIPSGVKPIICEKQIKEFYEFSEVMKNTKILVVLGYRFNKEDNNVNSFISSWLKKSESKMVFFNYKGETDLKKLYWIGNYYKIHPWKDGDNVIDISEKIINIVIDDNNKMEIFGQVIDQINCVKGENEFR